MDMETKSERRRRKLNELDRRYRDRGGLSYVASTASVSKASLEQIVRGVKLPAKQDGTRSQRALGDKAARDIEDKLGLGRGWFDATTDEPQLPEDAMAIARAFSALPTATQADIDARERFYLSILALLGAGRPATKPSTRAHAPAPAPKQAPPGHK